MNDSYLVPAATARTEIIVARSRFIATAGRVDTVEDTRAFLRSVRGEMPDATHHVYAFRVGYGSSVIEGMSDDGEPSGTAGPPALAVLRGTAIGNVMVIVTRYFGGTKLGTGGLVRAYSAAAREVLAALPVEPLVETCAIGVSVHYTHYQRLKQLLNDHQAEVFDEAFASDVTVYATLPVDQLPPLTRAIQDLTAGQSTPVLLNGPSD